MKSLCGKLLSVLFLVLIFSFLGIQRTQLHLVFLKQTGQYQATEALILPRFSPHNEDAPVVVLCTHTSVDKLHRVFIQHARWNGPMSASVFVTNAGELAKYEAFRTNYTRTDIDFSVHFESNSSMAHQYPHNTLRNLAVENARSDYLLPLDVDFLPSQNAHEDIAGFLQNTSWFTENLHNQTLFILPVFSLAGGIGPPQTRQELVTMYNNRTAKQWHYHSGHAKIDYRKWIGGRRQQTGSQAISYPILPKNEFEPYFICFRPGLPKYWEDFRGFGFDKVSFVHELILKGHQFQVLWDFFVVHLYHPKASQADRNALANQNADLWRSTFTPYLYQKYNPKGMAQERWTYPRFREYLLIEKKKHESRLKAGAAESKNSSDPA